jgi:hypothetical protein
MLVATEQRSVAVPRKASHLGRLALGFALAALTLGAIFNAAEWYADHVSLPRYCDDPEAAVARATRVLSEPRPAAEESRRSYVVAAKLIFLVPRRDGEPVEAYAARLRRQIRARCG